MTDVYREDDYRIRREPSVTAFLVAALAAIGFCGAALLALLGRGVSAAIQSYAPAAARIADGRAPATRVASQIRASVVRVCGAPGTTKACRVTTYSLRQASGPTARSHPVPTGYGRSTREFLYFCIDARS